MSRMKIPFWPLSLFTSLLFILPVVGHSADRLHSAEGQLLLAKQGAASNAAASRALKIESNIVLFPNKLANGIWNNCEVTVANNSDNPQSAQVLLRFNQFHITFMRQVLVPAHTKYAIHIPVLPDYSPDRFASFFHESKRTELRPDGTKQEIKRESGSLECIAGLVDSATGQEIQPFKTLTILTPPSTRNFVVVDDLKDLPAAPFSGLRNGLPFVLGDQPLNGDSSDATLLINQQLQSGDDHPAVQFSFIDSEKIPSSEEGYESVFVLLLGRHRPLNPAQKTMLERWLSSGGRLAVFPVANMEQYINDPFWQKLLPVELTGSRVALAEDAAAYQDTCGKALDLEKRLPMASALLRPGVQLLCGSKTAVLSAKRAYGAGEILFYALRGSDLKDSADLPSSIQFFRELSYKRAEALPGLQDRFRQNARNLLQALTGLPVPQKWVIAVLMILFLGVATGILVTLRLKKRGELGWLILMGWSLIVFLFALILLGGGNTSLSSGEIGITLLPNTSGAGTNRSYAGAFPSGDVRGQFTWLQAGAAFSPQSAAGNEALRESLAVTENYYPQMPQVQMLPGQFWGGQSLGQAIFGQGLSGQLRFTSAGVRGEVINQTGRKLTNCLLRINRRILYIGDMAEGGRADLARTESMPLNEFAKKDFGSGWAEKRDILSQLFYGTETEKLAAPVLIGFTTESLCSFSVDDDATKNSARQLIAVVPDMIAEKDAVIPAGMCGLSFTRTGSAMRYYGLPARPAEVTRLAEASIPPTPHARAGNRSLPAKARSSLQRKETTFDPQYDCAFPYWLGGSLPVRFSVQFSTPAGLLNFHPSTAILTLRGNLTGLRAEVLIAQQGSDQPKRLAILPSGSIKSEIKIPDYAIYAKKGGAEISIRMRPDPSAGTAQRWNLEELELQITGTAEK